MSQEIVSVHTGELVTVTDAVRYLPVLDEMEKVRLAVAQALEAPSLDAAMDVDGIKENWMEHVAETITVHAAWVVQNEDTTKRRPFYGRYDVTFPDGKRTDMFCGSVQPLAIANRAALKGEFPFETTLLEGIPAQGTKNGPLLFTKVKTVKGEGGDSDY